MSLISWHCYIGIPINYLEYSGIVTFWSIELSAPLEVSNWCESPLQKRQRPRAFSTVSTRYSYIPTSCEMKDEPAFQPLQGKLDFFWVRAARATFHLRQEIQSPSHIHFPEGKLLLRCLWKVGLSLQSKRGNQLSSPDDMGWTEHSSSCFTEIDVPLNFRWVSQGISRFS